MREVVHLGLFCCGHLCRFSKYHHQGAKLNLTKAASFTHASALMLKLSSRTKLGHKSTENVQRQKIGHKICFGLFLGLIFVFFIYFFYTICKMCLRVTQVPFTRLPPLTLIVRYFLLNCERAAEKLPEPNVRCWSQQRGDRGGGLSCSQADNVCSRRPPPPNHPPPTSPPFLRAIWDVWGSREVKPVRWRTHWPM